MPSTMEMREDGHVLFIRITDPWSVEEFANQSYGPTQAYYDKAEHLVHTIICLDAKKTPDHLLKGRRGAPALSHPNAGQLVIVGASPLLRSLIEVMYKLSGFTRGEFFANEDEAWRYLRQIIAQSQ
jgi:hypothetical protein